MTIIVVLWVVAVISGVLALACSRAKKYFAGDLAGEDAPGVYATMVVLVGVIFPMVVSFILLQEWNLELNAPIINWRTGCGRHGDVVSIVTDGRVIEVNSNHVRIENGEPTRLLKEKGSWEYLLK